MRSCGDVTQGVRELPLSSFIIPGDDKAPEEERRTSIIVLVVDLSIMMMNLTLQIRNNWIGVRSVAIKSSSDGEFGIPWWTLHVAYC